MINVDTSGTMMVTLKPRAERKLSVDQVIDSLRPKLNSVPGIRAMLVNPPPINVGGRRARSLYQLTLHGHRYRPALRSGRHPRTSRCGSSPD